MTVVELENGENVDFVVKWENKNMEFAGNHANKNMEFAGRGENGCFTARFTSV